MKNIKAHMVFHLILDDKSYEIPSGFRFFHDADPYICAELVSNKKYKVKSHPKPEVFQSFINYWVNRDVPDIDQDNIIEYIELSNEFDLMKEVIQVSQDLITANLSLEEKNRFLKDVNKRNKSLIEKNDSQNYKNLQNLLKLYNQFNETVFDGLEFTVTVNDVDYKLPPKFIFLNDLNRDIYNNLIEFRKYEVVSDVTNETFESFIDYCLKKEMPDINEDNYSEFEELSKEFNLMKDLIEMYKKDKENLDTKQKNFTAKTNEYKQIIHKLCENYVFDEKETFLNFKNELLKECKNENFKFIDLLIQKKVYQDGLIYVLDEQNKTSSVFRNHDAQGDIIIPTSVTYQSEEYVVTKIIENSFGKNNPIKTIQFHDDSKIQIIEKCAFKNSSIEKIRIPISLKRIENSAFYLCQKLKIVDIDENSELSYIGDDAFCGSLIENFMISKNVVNLKEGWCCYTPNLVNITISENNKNFVYIEDSYLLKKSNINNEYYDVLCFARRNIENATIPSYITRIAFDAFGKCYNLKTITFSEGSELKSIGRESFFECSIENILIPSHVSNIENGAFAYCKQLKNIEFPEDSELKSIEQNAFKYTSIKNILIPSHVKSIGNSAFTFCSHLENVEFEENSELEWIGDDAFKDTLIKTILIPSNISSIEEKTLVNCKSLRIIEFLENSALDYIDNLAFSNMIIDKILIPQHISKINNETFSKCKIFRAIEFMKNSELKIIGANAFSNTLIDNIMIPEHV